MNEIIKKQELDQTGLSLNDFLISKVAEVKDLAQRAENLQKLFDAGEISLDEYTELANDLLELKYINKEMVELEVVRELWLLVNFLKNVKFFASL